jgi:sulfate permease, SulP family
MNRAVVNRLGARAAATTHGRRHDERDVGRTGRAVVAGGVIGIVESLLAISFGSLVFAATLPGDVGTGIGVALFGAAVTMVLVALRSTMRAAVASIQDVTAAVLVVIAAAIAAELGGDDPRLLGTTLAAVMATTALTGVLLYLLGTLRLGRLVRFVPYPVIGGFLAGTGWVLLVGGIGLVVGDPARILTSELWASPDLVAKLLLGLAVAGGLYAGVRRGAGAAFLPLACIAVIAVSYLVILVGPGVDAARAGGWLLGPFPAGGLWPPDPALLADTDLGVIARQWLSIVTVAGLSAVGLLLNASGIELAQGDTDATADLDQELRAAGTANLLGAVGGGFPGFHALSLSSLAQRLTVPGRAAGLVAAGVVVVTLVFGTVVVAAMPTVLVGGLVAFLGIAFLTEWVVDGRRTLPRTDHAVVILIVVVIATIGFLEGVATGLLAAVVLFIRSASRIPLVRRRVDGTTYRSHVERPPEATAAIDRLGHGVSVLELQGQLFFGTADRLLTEVRAWLDTPARTTVRFLVLDLRHVAGIDTSALQALRRGAAMAAPRDAELVLTGVPDRAAEAVGTAAEGVLGLRVVDDLDRALQWCEDRLLDTAGPVERDARTGLRVRLTDELGSPALADRLLARLQPRRLAAGELLVRQGEVRRELWFVETGTVTVELAERDGRRRRLSTMLPGTVVGEIGFALGRPRSADVVADTDVEVAVLDADTLVALEHDDPELATALHRMLTRNLAARLSSTLATIEALGG